MSKRHLALLPALKDGASGLTESVNMLLGESSLLDWVLSCPRESCFRDFLVLRPTGSMWQIFHRAALRVSARGLRASVPV